LVSTGIKFRNKNIFRYGTPAHTVPFRTQVLTVVQISCKYRYFYKKVSLLIGNLKTINSVIDHPSTEKLNLNGEALVCFGKCDVFVVPVSPLFRQTKQGPDPFCA
jgi:hypothetical protein